MKDESISGKSAIIIFSAVQALAGKLATGGHRYKINGIFPRILLKNTKPSRSGLNPMNNSAGSLTRWKHMMFQVRKHSARTTLVVD